MIPAGSCAAKVSPRHKKPRIRMFLFILSVLSYYKDMENIE
jgi:hypothetical protein